MSDGRRGMVPQDLMRIAFVTDAQISPDGRRIAFVVTSLSEERDEYLSNIWIVDVAGGEPRRFTAGPRRDVGPRWSPDGRRLAFLSERSPKEKLQLYVMPADGGEPTRLTSFENGAKSVAWSPDGERLAFVSPVGGQREPESDEERRKSRPARVITSLKYRFNGEGFVYDRRPHVFVIAFDGAGPRQVTDGDFINADPAWAPDGQSIVFVSARHAEHIFVGDPGNVEQCVRMLAFNSSGMSDPSDTACITTPVIDVVTMKTRAIVTTSHRATDTSTIIAILVNASTVIGAGGLELTYPSKYTLTVSRRAGDKSSVISILVNKSTSVIINP